MPVESPPRVLVPGEYLLDKPQLAGIWYFFHMVSWATRIALSADLG